MHIVQHYTKEWNMYKLILGKGWDLVYIFSCMYFNFVQIYLFIFKTQLQNIQENICKFEWNIKAQVRSFTEQFHFS